MPAADQVVKGASDGHQLLITGPASIVVMPHMFSKITYDPMRDLVPVSMLGAGAFVLVVHPSVKANNVKELIALANKGKGGFWMGMVIVSAIGSVIGYFAHLFGKS